MVVGILLRKVWFPKHPRSIRSGDLLVYYAAGRGVFPAVVEVVSDDVQQRPQGPMHSPRWPWYMAVRRLPGSSWNFDGDPTGIVMVRR